MLTREAIAEMNHREFFVAQVASNAVPGAYWQAFRFSGPAATHHRLDAIFPDGIKASVCRIDFPWPGDIGEAATQLAEAWIDGKLR